MSNELDTSEFFFNPNNVAPSSRKIPWGIIGKKFSDPNGYHAYVITKVYPHFAVGKRVYEGTIAPNSEEKCFTIGDLVQAGLVPSMEDSP